MYQIGNLYMITAIAVIGGGLFGFDISSMSAMYVFFIPKIRFSTNFNIVLEHNNIAAILTKVPMVPASTTIRYALDQVLMSKVASLLPCLVVPSSVLLRLVTSPTNSVASLLSNGDVSSGS